eukprot:scaffold50078_cov51-Attheya_sp.AAC.2
MAPRAKKPVDPERQLMIKVKACQRLIKEAAFYVTELKENEDKLDKMKQEKRDVYDIKYFDDVVGESRMMVPDSQARMKKNIEDLEIFLDSNRSNLNADGEWMTAASSLLSEQQSVKSSEDGVVSETNVEGLKDGEDF